jgi:hypothetical protein
MSMVSLTRAYAWHRRFVDHGNQWMPNLGCRDRPEAQIGSDVEGATEGCEYLKRHEGAWCVLGWSHACPRPQRGKIGRDKVEAGYVTNYSLLAIQLLMRSWK